MSYDLFDDDDPPAYDPATTPYQPRAYDPAARLARRGGLAPWTPRRPDGTPDERHAIPDPLLLFDGLFGDEDPEALATYRARYDVSGRPR